MMDSSATSPARRMEPDGERPASVRARRASIGDRKRPTPTLPGTAVAVSRCESGSASVMLSRGHV